MATERGYDPEVWTQLAEQLGLVGLIVPEEHGGAGMGPVELLVAMEEMGRALLCAPYLGTSVLAANALLACADAADAEGAARRDRRRARDRVRRARGAERALGPRRDRDARAREGDGFELDGAKTFVLDGHVADVLLVVARTATAGSGCSASTRAPRGSRAR